MLLPRLRYHLHHLDYLEEKAIRNECISCASEMMNVVREKLPNADPFLATCASISLAMKLVGYTDFLYTRQIINEIVSLILWIESKRYESSNLQSKLLAMENEIAYITDWKFCSYRVQSAMSFGRLSKSKKTLKKSLKKSSKSKKSLKKSSKKSSKKKPLKSKRRSRKVKL